MGQSHGVHPGLHEHNSLYFLSERMYFFCVNGQLVKHTNTHTHPLHLLIARQLLPVFRSRRPQDPNVDLQKYLAYWLNGGKAEQDLLVLRRPEFEPRFVTQQLLGLGLVFDLYDPCSPHLPHKVGT